MSQFKSHRVSSGAIQHSGSVKGTPSMPGVARSNSGVNENIQTPPYVR